MNYKQFIIMALSLSLLACDESKSSSSETENETPQVSDFGEHKDVDHDMDGNVTDGDESGGDESGGDGSGDEVNPPKDEPPVTTSKFCYGSATVRCGEGCINPNTDLQYCGAKEGCTGYQACGDDEECFLGRCQKKFHIESSTCENGTLVCDGLCIDPTINRYYCGAKAGCTDFERCEQTYHHCQDGMCIIKINQAPLKEYLLKYFDKNHDNYLSYKEGDTIIELKDNDSDLLCNVLHLKDLARLHNLKKIGAGVFDGCSQVGTKKGDGYDYTGFTSSNIEELGDYAFRGIGFTSITMSVLTSVDVSSGSHGETFAEAPNLERINLGALTRTSFYMFKNSKHIDTLDNHINIPKLDWISRGTFYGCEGMTKFSGKSSYNVTRVDTEAFFKTGVTKVLLRKVSKIGFDENDNPGVTFSDTPELKCIQLNLKGDIEVSPTFIDKSIASGCKLILNKDKNPDNTTTSTPLANGNEWPSGSGILWKEIVFSTTTEDACQ